MKSILLVCTGNICRSPLAEAMLRKRLEDAMPGQFEVKSAGTGAWDGSSASEGAYLVALENELDISEHKAQLLTSEIVEEADLILTMARHHRLRVEELGGDGKVHLLGEFVGRKGDDAEVGDPFGGDIETYRETFKELEGLIDRVVERVLEEAQE